MIKFASAGVEGSPVSVKSKIGGERHLALTPWLVGNPTVPGSYEFISAPIGCLPVTDLRKRLAKKSSSTPSFSAPSWKDLVDGFFAVVFLTIVFSFSAWMFYAFTLEFASLGNLQFQDFWQRFL